MPVSAKSLTIQNSFSLEWVNALSLVSLWPGKGSSGVIAAPVTRLLVVTVVSSSGVQVQAVGSPR